MVIDWVAVNKEKTTYLKGMSLKYLIKPKVSCFFLCKCVCFISVEFYFQSSNEFMTNKHIVD